MMLVDAIATIILSGMMLIPLVNMVVGAIVGAGLGGMPGAIVGVMLAIAITLAQKMIGDWRGWFEVARKIEDAAASDLERGATTRRPSARRRPLASRRNRRGHPTVPVPDAVTLNTQVGP